MNAISESYSAVCWNAKRFALYFDENLTRKSSFSTGLWWALKNDRGLAQARTQLEMALAVYVVCRAKEEAR